MKKKVDKSHVAKSKVSSKPIRSKSNSSKSNPNLANLKSYLSKSSVMFLQSFKFDLKRLSYILFVDLLFYALIISSVMFATGLIEDSAKVLDAIDPQLLLDTQDSALVESTSATMQGFLTTLKITGAILILFFFITFSISAYLIWMKISNKKKTLKGYLKSTSFSFILLGLFFLLTFLNSQNMVDGSAGSAYSLLTFAFLILSAIIYAVYSRSNNLLLTLKEILRIITRIHYLILPLITSAILAFVLATSAFLIMSLALSIGVEAIIIAIVILSLTIYSAWFRNYIYVVVEDVLRR